MHLYWQAGRVLVSLTEMPYYFSRSSLKFEGHTGQQNHQFDPDISVADDNSSVNSQVAMK